MAWNVAFGDVTTPMNRDRRPMGATLAPASVDGLVIGCGSSAVRAALAPPEKVQSDLTAGEYDRTTLAGFANSAQRNLNAVCGLGAGERDRLIDGALQLASAQEATWPERSRPYRTLS